QLIDSFVKPAGPAINNSSTHNSNENEFAPNIEGFNNWYNGQWLSYTNDITKSLTTVQKNFVHELKSAPRLCKDIYSAIHDMTTDEVKKITTHLDRLEQRFKGYKDSFEKSIDNMNTTFKNNIKMLTDANIIPTPTDTQQTNKTYSADHVSFVAK